MSEILHSRRLPSDVEVVTKIASTGDHLTEDFDRLRFWLDHTAPVVGYFTIVATPPGFAPEEIRQQWKGLSLPIRFPDNASDSGYPGPAFVAREAIEALADERPEAYEWWKNHYASLAREDLEPGYVLSNVRMLVFDENCGVKSPLEYEEPALLSDISPEFEESPQPDLFFEVTQPPADTPFGRSLSFLAGSRFPIRYQNINAFGSGEGTHVTITLLKSTIQKQAELPDAPASLQEWLDEARRLSYTGMGIDAAYCTFYEPGTEEPIDLPEVLARALE